MINIIRTYMHYTYTAEQNLREVRTVSYFACSMYSSTQSNIIPKFEGSHPVCTVNYLLYQCRQYTTYAKTRCISTAGLYPATRFGRYPAILRPTKNSTIPCWLEDGRLTAETCHQI